MSKRNNADLLARLGPVDSWLLPASDIEAIILTGYCRHGFVPLDRCRECFTGALLRRQVTLLAERLGCSAEDAQAVSDTLCDQFLEERRR